MSSVLFREVSLGAQGGEVGVRAGCRDSTFGRHGKPGEWKQSSWEVSPERDDSWPEG